MNTHSNSFRPSDIQQNTRASSVLNTVTEEAFCRLIAQRTGIVLQDHQLSNLRDTVNKGCERFGYSDAEHYLEALQQSQSLTPPLEYMIAGVTVGESYFFRDNEQIELLRRELLPGMIAARRLSGNLSLRIWSAGCSQGQEIYTIALMLHELIPDIDQWRIHLLGTDINAEAVSSAMRGRYTEWSFRVMPEQVRHRWFVPVGNEQEIYPRIRNMVRFSYLNLTADAYPSILGETNAMDLILCRNVFIYLDREAVQRSMAQFAQCLVNTGVLILGASDPIYYQHTGLELVQNRLVGYFLKRQVTETEFSVSRPLAPISPVASKPRPVQADTAKSIAGILPRSPVPATPAQTFESAKQAPLSDEMKAIIKLLNASDWVGVRDRVETACREGREDSELWQLKAKAQANLGQLDEAQQACVRSLQLDPVNKHTYLMQGLILSELGRQADAEAALRKTLFLDHSFLEAHYELGMLRVRAKDIPGAIKSLENALKLARKGEPDRELHNAAGMSYQRFAQVLENEIEMLKGAR